ncbi:MAG: FtsX-like permease family protein, partial [Clostridia bacterium]|nr:FtsX-like permease family protein [Clostridia bacterium]
LKDDVQQGVLKTGLAYTSEFVKHILTDEGNLNSPIVRATDGSVNEDGTRVYDSVSVINPLINMEGIIKKYVNSAADVKWKTISYTRRALGGDDTVSKLSIYSRDYSAKEEIKTYLKAWNDKQTNEENIVHYSDSTAMLFSAMNSIVDAVKIVLIAFTAISLVVSSIMIGIITYVSVVERTKEIGVLRSLGARKKDISRIFNAETFLIGFFAGLIGVAVSYLLTIPINMIFAHFVSGATAIAVLKITDAMLLVTVSFVLTIIAGIIPSRIASKKDPVVALRTE